jgi:hypothetical protein
MAGQNPFSAAFQNSNQQTPQSSQSPNPFASAFKEPPQHTSATTPSSNPFASAFSQNQQPAKPEFHFKQSVPLISTPSGQRIASGISKGLDAQGWAVRKAITGESDTDAQMEKIRKSMPLWDWAYHLGDKGEGLSDIFHTGNPYLDQAQTTFKSAIVNAKHGVMDAAVAGVLDPLTYETLGAGPLAKTGAAQALKGMGAEAMRGKGLLPAAARTAHDYFTWAGPVARGDIGQGIKKNIAGATSALEKVNKQLAATPEDKTLLAKQKKLQESLAGHQQSLQSLMQRLQDIGGQPGLRQVGHRASSEGNIGAIRMQEIINKSLSGLNDDEHENVVAALNSEGVPSFLNSDKEARAFHQLDRIFRHDYATRVNTAFENNLTRYGTDLNEAERGKLRTIFQKHTAPGQTFEDLFPDVNIPEAQGIKREPYGPDIERTRHQPVAPTAEPEQLYAMYTAKMTPEEKATFDQGLTSREGNENLPPEMQVHLKEIQDAFASKFGAGRGMAEEAQKIKPSPAWKMKPDNQEEINAAKVAQERNLKLKGVYKKIVAHTESETPRRELYFPFKHYTKESVEGRPAYKYSPTNHNDPRFRERPDLPNPKAAQSRAGLEALAKNYGRQVKTATLHKELGTLLNDPEINKVFEEAVPATGNYRDDTQRLFDAWKATLTYPRAGIVAMSPGHMANEVNLLIANTDPQDLPRVAKNFVALTAKIFKARNAKEYSQATAEGRRLGTGTGSFAEHKTPFQGISKSIPVLNTLNPKNWRNEGLLRDLPVNPKLAGKPIPILSWWTARMSKLTWAADEAAATVMGQELERKGVKAAGGVARSRMVDYEYRTPFQETMRTISPFGTFEGGIPGAVLGAVGRNPARAAFYNRLTGGVMYGDRPKKDQPGFTGYFPTAKVSEGILNPGKYAMNALGSLPSASLGTAMNALDAARGRKVNWGRNPAAYGQTWLPTTLPNGQYDLGFIASQADAGIPQAQTFLESIGIGRFKWRGLASEWMRQGMRLQYTPPQ